MIIALLAIGLTVVAFGASTVSTREGAGMPIRETRFAVREDELGMTAVKGVGSQVAQAALQMKAGKLALDDAGLHLKPRAWFPAPGQ